MNDNEIVRDHIISLMNYADLTINGLAEGTNLTTMTIRKILDCKTEISSLTLDKLANFFGISRAQLLSSKTIKLKKIQDIPILNEFHNTNKSNTTYFISKSKEGIVAYFLKNTLIADPFLNEGKRVKEVARYIKTDSKYLQDFDPKVIAKEFERMHRSGILKREDKSGKGSVFYYSLVRPVLIKINDCDN